MYDTGDIPPSTPSPDDESINGLVFTGDNKEEAFDEVDAVPSECDLGDFDYPFRSYGVRGLHVVFNHKVFDNPKLRERCGTENDEKELKRVWKKLGFDVKTHDDCTKDEIFYHVANYAKNDAHKAYDCFACTVLSHGDKADIVHAKDDSYLVNELIQPFRDCESLIGKPKLFFIQACRGTKTDKGKKQKSFGDEPDSMPSPEEVNEKEIVTIPSESDFLIAYSTVEGYYSWRNSSSGSWFIQMLAKCIENHANALDLLQILTLVNKKVGGKESQSDLDKYRGKKQSPSIVSRLTRLVFFGVRKRLDPYNPSRDVADTGKEIRQPVLEVDIPKLIVQPRKKKYYELKLEASMKKKELAELEVEIQTLKCESFSAET